MHVQIFDWVYDACKCMPYSNINDFFDQMTGAGTQVFDDQQDYFNSNSAWMSEKEREKAARRDDKRRDKIKRHGRLRSMKVDFAGRVQIDREGDSDDESAGGAEKGPAVDSYSGRPGVGDDTWM